MNQPFIHIALSIMLCSSAAFADDNKANDTAKTIGDKTGEAVHAVSEAGKEVGHKVVETARQVGHATREGAKEFHKAVTGKHKKKSVHASGSASNHSTGAR